MRSKFLAQKNDFRSGAYFIVVIPASQTQTGRANLQQVQVVLNWFEELKQRVPVR